MLDLKSKTNFQVYCVAGNHDYHLLELINQKYPLDFKPTLTLNSNGTDYVFKHGWEFDLEQQESVMELLCHTMSDKVGEIRSGFWDLLTGSLEKDALKTLEDLFTRHNGKENYLEYLQTPPKERLKLSINDVEKKALASVKAGEILVFGHTHKPFVGTTKNIANCGSWVSDEEITNTYVELDGKEIHIMRYGVGDITDKVTHQIT